MYHSELPNQPVCVKKPIVVSERAAWLNHLAAFYAAKNLRTLINVGFRLLQSAVECDFASGHNCITSAGLAEHRDSRGRVYSSDQMRREAEVNPAITIVRTNPGIKVLPTKTGLPQIEEALHRLPFYHEFMKPGDWRHSVALCFWDKPAGDLPILVLSIFRRESKPDFSEDELSILEDIHSFLSPAVNHIHDFTGAEAVYDALVMPLQGEARGLVVLDWRLRLVRSNPAGRRACLSWIIGRANNHIKISSSSVRLPGVFMDACEKLRTAWREILYKTPLVRSVRKRVQLVHPCELTFKATITLVYQRASGMALPSFVVEFSRMEATGSTTEKPSPLAMVGTLTVAEREVASLVAEGYSNQEVATKLGKSLHATKFLLHSVFKKTGLKNRTRLSTSMRGFAPAEDV